MRRNILILIAVIIAAAAVYFVDFSTLWEALTGMSATSIVMLGLLLVVGSLVKAVRWAFYLRAAKLPISWSDGMSTYLAGMAAGAIPGGSWLPARLAQEHGGIRMRQAASSLFVSFICDMIALAILAGAMIIAVGAPLPRLIIPLLAICYATLMISMGRSERLWYFIDRWLAKFRLTRKLLPKEADIHDKVRTVMVAPVILRGVVFSIVTTTISIGILYVLVNELTFTGITLLNAFYVHSFSETTAMVIPSPGGIGVMDSSIAGLLNSLSIGWVRATFVVLTLRSIDLLFKTFFGTLMLGLFYHQLLFEILKVRSRVRTVRRTASFATRRSWRFMTTQYKPPKKPGRG